MWKPINDCGKQLTLHSKVREKDGDQIKVYDIIEVEFDQYKLELTSTNEQHPAAEKLQSILTCDQLIKFNFEVEEKGN